MKKRFLYLILPIITLILEILPYGAVCNFANPEGKPWRNTFSYFDLIPFGYANFAPLITAIITCFVMVLLVVYCVTGKYRLAVIARNIICVCSIISLGPVLYGINYFSVVGALITVSLIAELILIHFTLKTSRSDNLSKVQVDKGV